METSEPARSAIRSSPSRSSCAARAHRVAVLPGAGAALLFAGLLTNASVSILGAIFYLSERLAGSARCCRTSTT